MNRADRLQQIMRLEALAAAAKSAAADHRAELGAEAAAEFEREGTAPTWRLTDLGTITLPVSKETAYVHDPGALVEWCMSRYPSEVQTIAQLRPAFQAALLARLHIEGSSAVDTATGEEVPGLAVRPGGIAKSLSIRPSPEASAVFAEVGRQMLERLLAPAETPGGAE
jgi:hypothetical protein